MALAGALIYNSLIYRSQAPFYGSRPTCLTFDGLLRTLVWTDSERSRPVYEEGIDTQTRALADTSRLILQSFATTRDGKKFPLNAEFARMQAERRAFGFSSVPDGDSWEGRARWVPRDGFRGFAKEAFHGEEEPKRLHNLSIPRDEFQALEKMLLVMQFGRPVAAQFEQDADLDRVADCVVGAFVQVPGMGITWEMFDQDISKVPELFRAYYRLLSSLYKTYDENDTKAPLTLPKPGSIATLPFFSQLGTIIIETLSFSDIQLRK